MITPEALILAGWRKLGGAWYGPANKKLTNFDGGWQKWLEGKQYPVALMSEL